MHEKLHARLDQVALSKYVQGSKHLSGKDLYPKMPDCLVPFRTFFPYVSSGNACQWIADEIGSLKSSMMQHRGAVVSSLVLLLLSTSSPADAFFFGRLAAFFQPSPLFGIPTFFTPKSVGGIYINAFPFTTPPAGKHTVLDPGRFKDLWAWAEGIL